MHQQVSVQSWPAKYWLARKRGYRPNVSCNGFLCTAMANRNKINDLQTQVIIPNKDDIYFADRLRINRSRDVIWQRRIRTHRVKIYVFVNQFYVRSEIKQIRHSRVEAERMLQNERTKNTLPIYTEN